jgi:hypothetical protein
MRKTGKESGAEFTHVWHWRTRLPGRKGQRCRILAERKDGLLWIEFEDGFRTICSVHAVRVAPACFDESPQAQQLELITREGSR